MKISTIALGALISFSTGILAQSKTLQKDTTAKVKTTKCYKAKSTTKTDSANSKINKPKRHSGRYCPTCGMG